MPKRILIVSFRFPYPLTEGSRIRIYNLSEILAKKYSVDLLSINEGKIEEPHIRELEKTFRKVVAYPFPPFRFKLNTLKGLLSRDSLQIYYHHFRNVQKWIDRHQHAYDLIFCFHIRMTRYLRRIKTARKVIDFIDATSINYQEAQERATGLWRWVLPLENRRSLAYELRMMAEFDRAFITSPFDKAYLDRHRRNSTNRLVVIPNGVKEELFSRPTGSAEKDQIVFLGKMNYAPNVDAVTFFAREVYPLVKQKTGIRFLIVGTSPSREVLKLKEIDGVGVTGFVKDPYEYLQRAKLVVAPLRFSAGIQNKILEAMVLKKPVVATSRAVRGIEGEDTKHFVVADAPQGMASSIIDLVQNETRRRAIGNQARQLIEKKYRWELIESEFLGHIEKVLNG